MESAGVRYLHTSCFCIRNRTSERSERMRFARAYSLRKIQGFHIRRGARMCHISRKNVWRIIEKASLPRKSVGTRPKGTPF